MRLRTLALALACAAPAAPAAAYAAPPFHAERMVVTFDIHAVQVTDWRTWEETASGWTHASGTQTLGWDARRPQRADVTSYTRRHGVDFPPLVIASRAASAKLRAHRTGKWVDHTNGGCDSEGGCPDGGAPPRDTQRPLHCPDRTVRTTLDVSGERKLVVDLGEHEALWGSCQPDLPSAQVSQVPLRQGVRRIQRLRRGQTVTLKGSVEGGTDTGTALERCPARLTGDGDKECTVTEVVVKAHRLR